MSFFGGLSVKNKCKLNRVVNIGGKVVGERQIGLNELYENRVKAKSAKIAADVSHVLAAKYDLLPSRRRYRVPLYRYKTLRSQRSFVPMSIKFLNADMTRRERP